MSGLHLDIDQYNIILNTVIRVITAIIFLLFIIPLQIKEAGVKNGLRLLRFELLASGIIIFFVNTVGLSILLFKYFFGDGVVKSLTDLVTIFNSLGFFFLACLKFKIYHQQYTSENKRLHAKIEKEEVRLNNIKQKRIDNEK